MTRLPEVIRIRNGEKVTPTFSAAEYQARQDKLRSLMAEKGIEVAVFTSIHNINYYSDFLYCSFGRPYALIVTAERVVSVSANIDGGQPWRRTQGDDNLIYTDWKRDNYFRALQQEIRDGQSIGIEYDHMTLERFAKLQAAFPASKISNLGSDTMQLRMVKSAEEIAHIRQGAQVCDIGGAALVEALGEGVPEHEIALASTQAMVREIARRYPHSELMDTWTWFQSGLNTDGAHNPVTTRRCAPATSCP
ncbi:MAG: aminopeptidase P family N-terminal domain-containing protein [Thiolinea sp.]